MGTRVFIGRLSNSARDRDVERFFKGYGKILEIVLKTGFGFVEFEDPRDADDAVYDLNGKTLCGERVTIEHARSPNERYQARSSYGRRPSHVDRSESPRRTDYRILVENLSSRVGRQELREFLNKIGEVTFADVNRDRNEGVAEFASLGDMKNVLTKLNGVDLRGRKVRLVEDRGRHRSKSPSRKRSAAHSKSRSRTRSRSPRRSHSPRRSRSQSLRRSHSRSGHRSRSPRTSRGPRLSNSPRASRSESKGKKSTSRSPSRQSPSASRSRSRARSSSGGEGGGHDDRVNSAKSPDDDSHSD